MKLKKDVLKELIIYGAIFALALFISSNVLFRYNVIGESMSPTLENGDLGFALRTKLGLQEIKRFDIVVIESPSKYLVKRIIGLPGETVEYKDNKLYIDGNFVEESFIDGTETEDFTVTLGNNEYYVLGDNRIHSLDSRAYGPFMKEQIIAILFKD